MERLPQNPEDARNHDEVEDPVMETFGNSAYERAREWILHHNLEHLHGPEEIEYGTDELVVLCLVRDGQPYMRSFIEHYFSLGVRHIIFLDNGSRDDTVPIAREYDNVTVFRSRLPFKRYRVAMKRYLIKRFGRERWTLCVDVDELFDYPHSDVVGLESLLGYLNQRGYTAVVAHMLDMFKETPLSDRTDERDGSLKDLYRFYEVSNVDRADYRVAGGAGNEVSNEEIEVFRGGVQRTLFDHPGLLTKHPLVFLDEKVELMERSAHWVSGARVADFTGVLFHYKFLDGHFRESVAQAVREENRADNSRRYKLYLKALEEDPEMRIRREAARELGDVNDLISDQFLLVSGDYMLWVDREEAGGEGPPQRRRRLLETFSRIRQETETQATRFRSLEEEVADLERSLNRERRKTESLRQRNLELSDQARKIQSRLGSMKNSRGWRMLRKLGGVRNRILKTVSRGRGK